MRRLNACGRRVEATATSTAGVMRICLTSKRYDVQQNQQNSQQAAQSHTHKPDVCASRQTVCINTTACEQHMHRTVCRAMHSVMSQYVSAHAMMVWCGVGASPPPPPLLAMGILTNIGIALVGIVIAMGFIYQPTTLPNLPPGMDTCTYIHTTVHTATQPHADMHT